MDLDLRQLLRLARQWWWLLLLAPLAASLTAFAVSERQPELYSASARLRITPGQSTTDDYNAILAGQQLGETYRLLLLSQPVLDRAIRTLGLPYELDEFEKRVTSSAIEDTQLFDVSVSDTDPERAAAIANTIANEFTEYVGEQVIAQTELPRSSIDQQIGELDAQIAAIDERIAALEASVDPNATAVQTQLADLRAQRTRVQESLADLQITSRQISVNLAAAQTQVTVADPATVPEAPYAPRTVLSTALGAFAGLILAIGAIVLNQYLDNSVKPTTDFQRLTGSPLLSAVATMPNVQPGHEQLFTLGQPMSASAEAMRLLRANIEFAAATRPIASLAVTSAGPSEGKSTITANLGVVLAQAGFSTVIMDADLRRPSQHRIFNTRNSVGLASLLSQPEQPWQWAAVQTDVPNLAVIPSGPIPPNPADLLTLERLAELMTEIGESVDVLLLDTPPTLAVSDALVVATNADGVILVGQSGETRLDAFRHAVEAFEQGGIRLVGVVVNRQTDRDSAGYTYGTYYGLDQAAHRDGQPTAPPVHVSSEGQPTAPPIHASSNGETDVPVKTHPSREPAVMEWGSNGHSIAKNGTEAGTVHGASKNRNGAIP